MALLSDQVPRKKIFRSQELLSIQGAILLCVNTHDQSPEKKGSSMVLWIVHQSYVLLGILSIKETCIKNIEVSNQERLTKDLLVVVDF